MSFQLMAWACEQTTGSATRKAVLLALANRANHDTGRCDPSVARIAAETELSPTTVKKALRDLADAGLVEVIERKHEDGGQRTNAYRFPNAKATGGVGRRPGGRSGGDPRGGSGGDPEPGSSPNQEDEPGTTVAQMYDPLVGVRVEGRDVPWDALAEATEATSRAYGPRMRSAVASIRADIVDWLAENRPDALARAQTDPDGFERAVAETITLVARTLRDGSDGTLTWGPEGVARNFRRGLTMIERRSTSESGIQAIVDEARRQR